MGVMRNHLRLLAAYTLRSQRHSLTRAGAGVQSRHAHRFSSLYPHTAHLPAMRSFRSLPYVTPLSAYSSSPSPSSPSPPSRSASSPPHPSSSPLRPSSSQVHDAVRAVHRLGVRPEPPQPARVARVRPLGGPSATPPTPSQTASPPPHPPLSAAQRSSVRTSAPTSGGGLSSIDLFDGMLECVVLSVCGSVVSVCRHLSSSVLW
jgi:hypothetical protein